MYDFVDSSADIFNPGYNLLVLKPVTVWTKHSLSANAEQCIWKSVTWEKKLEVTKSYEESQTSVVIHITVNLGEFLIVRVPTE